MIKVTAYVGMSKTFTIGLTQGGVGINLPGAGVSRVRLVKSGLDIDSANEPTAIDWTTEGADGSIIFNIGSISNPVLPTGKHFFTLVTYDPLHPNGQPFDDAIQVDALAEL